MLRDSIHSCLLADSRVTDLIGAGTLCRHYAERAQQGPTLPFAVSNEITGLPASTHGTETDAEDTMDETLIQFTCVGDSNATAESVRNAIRAALLDDLSDILATAHIVVTSPRAYSRPDDELQAHTAMLDVTFFHNPNT